MYLHILISIRSFMSSKVFPPSPVGFPGASPVGFPASPCEAPRRQYNDKSRSQTSVRKASFAVNPDGNSQSIDSPMVTPSNDAIGFTRTFRGHSKRAPFWEGKRWKFRDFNAAWLCFVYLWKTETSLSRVPTLKLTFTFCKTFQLLPFCYSVSSFSNGKPHQLKTKTYQFSWILKPI